MAERHAGNWSSRQEAGEEETASLRVTSESLKRFARGSTRRHRSNRKIFLARRQPDSGFSWVGELLVVDVCIHGDGKAPDKSH